MAPYSNALIITFAVLVITYLTLIFGELVPKRIALNFVSGYKVRSLEIHKAAGLEIPLGI